MTQIQEKITSFVQGCERILDEEWERQGYTHTKEAFSVTYGKRYAKVIRGTSVHCFIDLANGDVLKPASWKAPAKRGRGNIFDAHNGLAHMSWTGPAYLR